MPAHPTNISFLSRFLPSLVTIRNLKGRIGSLRIVRFLAKLLALTDGVKILQSRALLGSKLKLH